MLYIRAHFDAKVPIAEETEVSHTWTSRRLASTLYHKSSSRVKFETVRPLICRPSWQASLFLL